MQPDAWVGACTCSDGKSSDEFVSIEDDQLAIHSENEAGAAAATQQVTIEEATSAQAKEEKNSSCSLQDR